MSIAGAGAVHDRMRRAAMVRMGTVALAMLGALTGVQACANQGPPPGGPPDEASPLVLSVTPGTMSTVTKPGQVELRFDEVISETPSGAKDLADLVFISPRSGEARVDWGRTRMRIRPSRGWKPNTVYSVRIKPGIVDLRGNSIDTAITVVFSTGGPIPNTRVQGVAFDWGAGRGLVTGVVEAITPDSTVYQTTTDSVGRFELRHLPPGAYAMRAYADKNSNKQLDPLEMWDGLPVTVVQNTMLEFYAFVHDTMPMRIADVQVQDSNRVVKLVFDKPYAPEQIFPLGTIRIRNRDSADVPVKLIQTAREKLLLDSLRAKQKADSIAAVRRAKDDSLPPAVRARNDSIARVRSADSAAAVERQRRDRERAEARDAAARARQRGARPRPPRDTTPPPKMNRPTVYTEVYITLDSALPPQSQFRVQVAGVRNLTGVVKPPPGRTFTTAREAKPDSAGRGGRPPGAAGAAGTAGTAPTTPPPGRPPVPPPVRRDTLPALFIIPSRR